MELCPPSCVRLNNCLADIGHAGCQTMIYTFPTLFLTMMDCLLRCMRESNHGLSMRAVYTGAAIHADDLRPLLLLLKKYVIKYCTLSNIMPLGSKWLLNRAGAGEVVVFLRVVIFLS